MNRCGMVCALAASALLAGCAPARAPLAQAGDPALSSPDPLVAAAALLLAAEAAANAGERAPLIARLDRLEVTALPDMGDDPLAEWRREYTPPAGEVWRGRTLGPGYRRARLAPGERLVIDQIFYAGIRADMAAQTRGGQPVELAVANRQAGKVCEAQLSPSARCRWLPIFTERFSITLVNQGNTPASVYLVFD